jgi:subtilisin family serine protease
MLGSLSASAQTYHPDFLDGVLYAKKHDSSQINLADYDSSHTALNRYIKKYDIDNITQPFTGLNQTLTNTYRIHFNKIQHTDKLKDSLHCLSFIEYAEKAPLYKTQFAPNDYSPSEQWYLDKIEAPGGWDETKGDTNITIAIVDNAVYIDHHDLKDNKWINQPEKGGFNGLDDDQNGYLDDYHGYDVADDDNNPRPPGDAADTTSWAHGTAIAGLASATTNNDTGVASIGFQVKIMSVKCATDSSAGQALSHAYDGVKYAIDAGADIINMSFGKGYSPYKEVVDQAVKYTDDNGVLMVHGAGNEAKNTDKKPSYPTDTYGSDIFSDSTATLWLSVGATAWKPDEEFIANFSNYGNETVDLFAPGVDIYSTMPENEYEFQSGTSMASPVVAGTAALIIAYYPDLSPQQVRQIIMENTVKYPDQKVVIPHEGNPEEARQDSFSTLSVSDGVVNAYEALRAAEKASNR